MLGATAGLPAHPEVSPAGGCPQCTPGLQRTQCLREFVWGKGAVGQAPQGRLQVAAWFERTVPRQRQKRAAGGRSAWCMPSGLQGPPAAQRVSPAGLPSDTTATDSLAVNSLARGVSRRSRFASSGVAQPHSCSPAGSGGTRRSPAAAVLLQQVRTATSRARLGMRSRQAMHVGQRPVEGGSARDRAPRYSSHSWQARHPLWAEAGKSESESGPVLASAALLQGATHPVGEPPPGSVPGWPQCAGAARPESAAPAAA